MKIKSILISMLAIAALVGCSDNNDEPTPPGGDSQTAYLSLRITYPTSLTRASSEDDGSQEESAINSLRVITFDKNKMLVHHSTEDPVKKLSSSDFTGSGTGAASSTNPIKVSSSTKYLLIIANPGANLEARLNTLTSGSSYSVFNDAISVTINDGEDRGILADEIRTAGGTNFAMINAGTYNESTSKWEDDCLVDVSGKVFTVSSDLSESDAITQSGQNKASLMIERLSAKVQVTIGTPDVEDGGTFNFIGWALDYRNSTYYPFAKKTTTESGHGGGTYTSNFYTVDPNFTGAGLMSGIYMNELNANLSPNVSWITTDGSADYCIENTMDAPDQKYGAATRIVIKAQYAPAGYTIGNDWFSYAGLTYENLADLKAAYTTAKAANPTAAFVVACENFFDVVEANTDVTPATDFSGLTETHLNAISDGGEITKIPDCIRWYKGSLNYYYYEIRHDNAITANSGYGKYGVVRNNWYNLTLTKVKSNGTPWYPGGGPGEPDPEDPIDEGTAFLSFDITVGPWIYWTTPFEI